jgi:hypothetical protein
MSNKLCLKDIQKYQREHVLALSGNGVELRAVCVFSSSKIVYNVHLSNNLIEVCVSLDEAVKCYNDHCG